MTNFNRNRNAVPMETKPNNETQKNPRAGELLRVKRNIYLQAGLAFLTIILTIVILFSMTAAWYTNIVQTSGLVFQVEEWGFDSEINFENALPILASPGDEGSIWFSVSNENDSIIDVSVNVKKTNSETGLPMDAVMQRRLYFYVDTGEFINGEQVERVYLNSFSDYTYTVFNNSSLTFSEDYSNAPKIKWHWVYDVLGYYVLARDMVVTDDQGNEVQRFAIEEYLRPIEYNYDDATFVTTTDENGNITMEIETVDGMTTLSEFISEVTSSDGYQGSINEEDLISSGEYYKIADYSNGLGVYIYLCSYGDIIEETKIDTNLGQNANNLQEEEVYDATLVVSAQQSNIVPEEITSVENLEARIEESAETGEKVVLQLSGDLDLGTESLDIPTGADVMIDLNDRTITYSGTGRAITPKANSSVTLVNGAVNYNGEVSGNFMIRGEGAEINLSDIKSSGFDYGIYIGDNAAGNTVDSKMHITNCEFNTGTCTVFVSGNGDRSEQKTQVVIEDSNLVSEGYIICGNGTSTPGSGRYGTDIQVINSTLTSTGVGNASDDGSWGACIYHPQKDSDLTVYGCTLEGFMGIGIKGGTVNIIETTIKANGIFKELTLKGSGFSNTGDAVYIETGYNDSISLYISGCTLSHTDTASKSFRVYEENTPGVSVKIEDTTLDEAVDEKYLAPGATQTSNGGKYYVSPSSDKSGNSIFE